VSWGSHSRSGSYTVQLAGKQVGEFIKSLSPDEQSEVVSRLESLERDPTIDGIERITLFRFPALFGVDVASRFWIVFHVHGQTVDVYNIGRATVSAPAPW
jgi:hypothetical protein